MPEFRDVAVHIICDDVPLAEYDIQEDVDKKTVTCWVASEVGKTFEIQFQNYLRSRDEAKFSVYMDDSKAEVDHRIIKKKKSGTIKGAIVSENSVRAFQFASLATTDEESAVAAKSSWEHLGSIKICVRRVRVLGTGRTDVPVYDMTGAFKATPVHELSKKAGTHRISLGDIVPSWVAEHIKLEAIDGKKSPYATFLFRYRPRELLQAQGIIPASIPAPDQLCASEPDNTSEVHGTASEAALPTQDKGKKRAKNSTNLSDSSSCKRQRTSATEVPVKLERPSDYEDVKPTVDDLDNDASSDAELSIIKQQLEISMEQMQTLKKQMEKIEARKRSKATKGVVKKRASSAALGEQCIIDLT